MESLMMRKYVVLIIVEYGRMVDVQMELQLGISSVQVEAQFGILLIHV